MNLKQENQKLKKEIFDDLDEWISDDNYDYDGYTKLKKKWCKE